MSIYRRVTEVCVVMTLYGSCCVVLVLMGSFISNIATYFDENISIRYTGRSTHVFLRLGKY